MTPIHYRHTGHGSCYPDGQPYLPAQGRYAPRSGVMDLLDSNVSVVQGRPDADEFVRLIVREMKIRFYQPKTVKSFATHSYEDGCDIRRIQKLLGHTRLETTTIYVKVAQPTDETVTSSPLDKLYHAPPRISATNTRRTHVGQLRIHFLQQESTANCRCAKVTLSVGRGERPIYFTGIIAKEVRRGFVTLDIPPLEHWSEALSWLTRPQRERFEEPEFYELLQREISTRLCQLPSTPS